MTKSENHRKEIRVFLADDHQLLLDSMVALIQKQQHFECIGTAVNGKIAWQKIQDLSPDVAILDAHMPLMGGLELSKKIKKRLPETKIIILSMDDKGSLVRRFMQFGVHGYLLKNADATFLLQSIERVMDGERVVDPQLKNSLLFDNNTRDKFMPELTRRENEVLELTDREMTLEDIASELHLSVRTIEFHRKNLFEKFRVKNVVGLIQQARNKGYL